MSVHSSGNIGISLMRCALAAKRQFVERNQGLTLGAILLVRALRELAPYPGEAVAAYSNRFYGAMPG